MSIRFMIYIEVIIYVRQVRRIHILTGSQQLSAHAFLAFFNCFYIKITSHIQHYINNYGPCFATHSWVDTPYEAVSFLMISF